MGARPSRRPSDQAEQPPRFDEWAYVREFPAVAFSAPNKLAWHFLWERSQQGREQVIVTPQEVGRAQGSQDGGRDRIQGLLAMGVVRSHPHPRKGCYRLEILTGKALWEVMEGLRPVGLPDPQRWFEFRDEHGTLGPGGEEAAGEEHPLRVVSPCSSVAEPQRRPRAGSPEGGRAPPHAEAGLLPGEVPGLTGEVPGEVPDLTGEVPGEVPSSATSHTHRILSCKFTSHIDRYITSPTEKVGVPIVVGPDGRSPGTSPATPATDEQTLTRQWEQARRAAGYGDGPPCSPLAAAAQQLVAARCSVEAQEARIRSRIAVIMRRVDDPAFARSVAARLAWACEEFGLAWEGPDGSVLAALRDLDEKDRLGLIHKTRSHYFVGAAKRLLRRCGAPERREGANR